MAPLNLGESILHFCDFFHKARDIFIDTASRLAAGSSTAKRRGRERCTNRKAALNDDDVCSSPHPGLQTWDLARTIRKSNLARHVYNGLLLRSQRLPAPSLVASSGRFLSLTWPQNQPRPEQQQQFLGATQGKLIDSLSFSGGHDGIKDSTRRSVCVCIWLCVRLLMSLTLGVPTGLLLPSLHS